MSAHRAGIVALIGRPNAGKSTLLNRLVGQKLAIVTPRPQTTRSRILGILSRPDAQIVLLDTPGMHSGSKPLNVAMNEQVDEAARDADAVVVLVDLAHGWGEDHAALVAQLERAGTPHRVVGTKADLPAHRRAPWPDAAPAPLCVSGRTGEGTEALVEEIVRLLPESPPLYPGDEVSDRTLRFLAAELVREAAFEALEQELPYALAVEVDEFDESRDDLVRIRANLIVERGSQKGIVIGEGGRMIKRIGTHARREIEALLEQRVHLDLWVKVEPKWSKRPNRLKSLGYW